MDSASRLAEYRGFCERLRLQGGKRPVTGEQHDHVERVRAFQPADPEPFSSNFLVANEYRMSALALCSWSALLTFRVGSLGR